MRPAPPPGPPGGPASSSGAATPAHRAGRSGAPAATTALLLPGRRALRSAPPAVERDGLQPGALVFEPWLEFRRAADEESLEQVARVEVERIGQSVVFSRARELDGVAADLLWVEADVLVTSGHEHTVTERMPQPVQCLAERGAGMLLIELGPE